MRRRVLISTSLLSLLAVAPLDGVAAGQDNPFERGEKDRFSISLGTFVANFDTVLRLDSAELGVGTTIDLEDDLSYPRDRTDTRLDGYVRLGRKHRLEFGALILDRNKSTVTSRRIQFGEEVYDVGASVDSEFRNRVL
ncbi:MAG: hypothetical protein JSV80_06330, partial [Acidobacteriota bacterium]